MSNFQDEIIAGFRNNIKKIIHLYESEKARNQELLHINEQLKQEIAKVSLENEQLKQKNNTAELAKAFVDATGSNHEAKIKVNRIVREIDKCISLLNK